MGAGGAGASGSGSYVSYENTKGDGGGPMLLDVYFVHGGRPISFAVDSLGGSGGRFSDDYTDVDGGEKPLWSMELFLATLDWNLIPLSTTR